MIFTGSTIVLTVEAGTDLTSGVSPVIKYEKPDGTTGSWTATISGTKLMYDVTSSDLDQVGVWKLQASITLSGEPKLGRIAKLTVDKPL